MDVHSILRRTLTEEPKVFKRLDTCSDYHSITSIMDDDGDDNDAKRKTRNLSEKKRRDQFNMLVTELSNLISHNNRKMDKTTILKSTVTFLRNHNEVTVRSRAHDVQEDWKPAFLSNEEFTYLVLEALEGFIMVFSASGRIHYASESISSLLGHNPAVIVNKSIFDMMYDDDRQNLYNLLQRDASANEQIENQSKENEMIGFQAHIRRGSLEFREEVSYDLVQFYGHFRTNQEHDNELDLMDFRDVESRVLFVCIGCLHTPQLIRDVSLVDTTRNEFTSRHSLEWKFLFLDHRAPPIIGYLPFEVLGTSGYDYYHYDDLEKVVTCHEALMQKGELTSCYYRFLTKGQQWIWLQTRFYITYHQWNSKPEFVVCTHRVVSYADAIKTKEEEVEQDTDVSESDNVASMKETPVKDSMPAMSPSYMSEATNDAYGNSYQPISQNETIKSTPPPTTSWPDRSKYSLSTICENVPSSFDPPLQEIFSFFSTEDYLSPLTPMCTFETGPLTNTYTELSKPASVKSVSANSATGAQLATATAAATWGRPQTRYTGGSDTSVSGESHSSQRNSERESQPQPQSQALQPPKQGCVIVPQHGMGAQYLDLTSYAGAVSSTLLPMTPPLAPQDQAQIQEQLQRKHEELQQMIVRQQEELRLVKEQLLLARLGILQPLINTAPNQYSTQEEMQNQQRMAQLTYTNAAPNNYPAQGPLQPPPLPSIPSQPSHTQHTPHTAHPPHPPHPDHQHMPQ